MKPKKNLKITYILLIIGLPVTLTILGVVLYVSFVGSVGEPDNPQDSSGWLFFLLPLVAGVTFLAGLIFGTIASLIIYLRTRSKSKNHQVVV